MKFINFFFCVLDNSEPTPLMEGEGRSFRVLGFNQSQRAIFVQTLMRYIFFTISGLQTQETRLFVCIDISSVLCCKCFFFVVWPKHMQVWSWKLRLEGVCSSLEAEDL